MPRRHLVAILTLAVALSLSHSACHALSVGESFTGVVDLRYSQAGRPLHAAAAGDFTKRPVIFIHGTGATWQTWSGLLASASFNDQHTIAVDRPGYGGSGLGWAEPSLGMQAESALGFLRFNQSTERAILVGYSYGGAVAVRMALDHPERVAALVLLAPALAPRFEGAKWYEIAVRWGGLRGWLPPEWVVAGDESVAIARELELQEHRYRDIRVPIIYIQGDRDTIVSVQTAAYVSRMFTGTRVETWWAPGVDHALPMRRPDLILRALTDLKARELRPN